MRRLISIILAATLTAAALSSCTGVPGRDGRDGICTMTPIPLTVPNDMWRYSNQEDNNYFYATFNMPEIHNGVLKDGAVNMYRIESNGAQSAMPAVRHREYFDDVSREWFTFTETLDFEYDLGTLTIFYTRSDFLYNYIDVPEALRPGDISFRCVVTY